MTKVKASGLAIPAKALHGALKTVAGVVERRSTIPILSNLKLEANGTALTVTATDLDVWITAQLDLPSPAHVSTTVCARTLAAIASKLGAGDLTATLGEGGSKMTIASGRASFDVPVLAPEDFPSPTSQRWDAQFEMNGAELAGLFEAVRYAVSTEETRYYLNGVFLHVRDGMLAAAATDGHRLARKLTDLPEGAGEMPAVIVPTKAVDLIIRLADGAIEPVSIRVSATRIELEIDAMTIDSKLIDGTFPDYARVIPTANGRVARVDPCLLRGAAERVAVVSTDRTRAIRMDVGKGRIELAVNSPENGQGREDLPADCSGEPLTIGFNGKYLDDVLKRSTGNELTMSFGDAAAPVLIADNGRPTVTQVIMPMRV